MGSRPLNKQKSIVELSELRCLCCNEKYNSNTFYDSDSLQYRAIGKIPYCPNCIETIYNKYLDEFTNLQYTNPDKRAVQRLCMTFDLYYDDKIFSNALADFKKNSEKSKNQLTFIAYYFRHVKLYQYRTRNYNTTILNDYKEMKSNQKIMSVFNGDDDEQQKRINKASEFFGAGFSDEDYLFLQHEYDDWTSRHECQTKAQEELIKQICFIQLDLFRARLSKDDSKVKDLNATLMKQMDAAKLQPKQNKVNATSEIQTLGTLIDYWEHNDPIPEVDPELKDVDKIALMIDVFYRGHLAKVMGLKNGVSRYYDEYMAQYTVQKPKGNSPDDNENIEDDSEAIFDALFGNINSETES